MATPICTFVTEGHDAITAIMAVGTIMIIYTITQWSSDTRKRLEEYNIVTRSPSNYLIPTGRDEAFLTPENLATLPSVAFIMAVKWNSIKTASPVDTWRSQVLTAYGGKHECIFVVESEDDGAVPVLEALKDELKEQGSKIRIVVAGLSTTCTQKIHNMVAGVGAASAGMEYVLFLDANTLMHPGTVSVLVVEMMDDPKLFATSGYPLDIPMPGSTPWAWSMCQYRYLVMCEFGRHRAVAPWGGAMLMRKAEIDNDVCQIKTRWTNGGYSDDLLVGGAAADHGRTICTPLRALFPNPMKGDITRFQAWDFIRRQAFTLTTFYSCGGGCRAQSGLLVLYAFIKGLLLPSILLSICIMSSLPLCAIHARTTDPLMSYHLALSMLCLASFWYVTSVQLHYLKQCWNLAQALSPGKKIQEYKVSRWMQMVSLLTEATMAPFVAMSLFRRRSWWGGILYHVWGGKVTKVERPSPNSKAPAAMFSPTAATAATAKGRPLLAEPRLRYSIDSAEMVAMRVADAS